MVDVASASAMDGLEEALFAGCGKDRLPVKRVFQVAQGAVGGAFGKLFVGQQEGRRKMDAELGGQRVVEELVVAEAQNGLLITTVPCSAACFRKDR